jgi:hypothetical protein
MRYFYCFLIIICFQSTAFPQIVGVDHFRGAVQANIPITNITSGSISLGVSLNYYSSGVHVKDLEGNAGMGWQLNAGGAITRELRGYPDDQTDGTIDGWLLNSSGTYVNGFSIANDNSYSTCSDGATDLSYLSTYFPSHTDTEPDIFYVSAPGLNCRLVLDASHNFKAIPYQDIIITYHLDTYNNLIDKFTIVNDRGITYTFDVVEMATRQTVSAAPSSINVFRTDYEQFKNGVTYVRKWHLSKIEDLNGNSIDLTFVGEGAAKSSSSPVVVIQAGASSESVLYNVNETYTPKLLKTISNMVWGDIGYGLIRFAYTTSYNKITLIDSISTRGQNIKFDYIDAKSVSGGTPVYGRSFLSHLSDGTDSPFDYKFSYEGVDPANVLGPITSLPDSTSIALDYWGYYNGSSASTLIPEMKTSPYGTDEVNGRYHFNVTGFTNANYHESLSGETRIASSAYATAGALKTITNALGGIASIDYELNKYIDFVSTATVKGAGIRVSRITESDLSGIKSMRNFYYEDPTNVFHKSSGKPIALPSFAFPTVYSGGGSPTNLNSTIRGESDLSNEDTGIIYQYVRETNGEGGSVLYEFTVPATHYDTSVSPDWGQTVSYANMPSCVTSGLLTNLTRSYPYAPNPNYEFERGLTKKMTAYNSDGQRVSETSYDYSRTGSPDIISAIRIDENAGAIVYAKYSLLTNVAELMEKKTTTTYEPSTQTQQEQQVVDYYYQGTGHKEPTQAKTTNSDGSIARTYTKYLRDYNYSGASDDNSTTLLALKNLNVNVPIETYSQLEKSSVNKTISAALTKFKTYSFSSFPDLYLPAQQLALLAADGLTDFQVSAISSGNFANDSRYNVIANQLSYTYFGLPLSSDNNRNQVKAVIPNVELGVPVVMVNNAAAEEVLVNTFDGTPASSFFAPTSYTYNVYTTDNHTGTNALDLGTSALFSGMVKKRCPCKILPLLGMDQNEQ